jgi:hypothetical protein
MSVEGPQKVMVGEPLKIKCSASVYNFSQVIEVSVKLV